MRASDPPFAGPATIEHADLPRLLEALRCKGYVTLGPTVRDGAVVYDGIESVSDLPAGWTDEQTPGSYRLKAHAGPALFAYTAGAHPWKRHLHPPAIRLWKAARDAAGFRVFPENREAPRYALFGIRSCELQALARQDQVLRDGEFGDPVYRMRRHGLFLVAVACTRAGGTCFCSSMETGPRPASGYDLLLTEMISGGRHFFVAEAGSPQGAEVLAGIPSRPASEGDLEAARRASEDAVRQMNRSVDTSGIKELLYRSFEHPRWDATAERCLGCGNCTLACPTCFCTTVEDSTDLAGRQAERWRKWDSCFTADFSYIHGGSVRQSVKSRYRQWLTHKFATWIDQFGASGCVGCGRCITWCPAGIDVTEELRVIRETALAGKEEPDGNA